MTDPHKMDVVVPAHNAAATLADCLAAIKAAGFSADEIILADDASTDTTPQIAADAGVKVVRLATAQGAAAARNHAAAAGSAPLIQFVDADVTLHPGTRAHVSAFFAAHPDHAGIIGSYDAAPPAPGTVSRIRNLLHHHTHQETPGDVASFWTGCGALRRADFDAVGGFEPGHLLEDVMLGMALARAGRSVRLDPTLQCTHLKRWTWRSMVRADLFYRALPWSRMLLDPRNADVPAALNAGAKGKISVLLAGAVALSLIVLLLHPGGAAALAVTALAGLAALHFRFLRLILRHLGAVAAAQAVAVLCVHYLCAGTGFAIALIERLSGRVRAE